MDFPFELDALKVFSFTRGSSGPTLETDTGYTSHLIGLAIPDPTGAIHSPVDSKCFRRTGSIQARAGWLHGQALYVFQVSDHVC